MGIEFQGTAQGARPGNLIQFNFNKTVIAYTVGITAFRLSYGSNDDHWVQNLVIKISGGVNESPVAVPNQVGVTVTMELQDSSGHSIDPSNSVVWPMCIAITDSAQVNTNMSNVYGISNNSYQTVSLPNSQSGYSVANSFLSGFNLSYNNGDHQVLLAQAGCGLSPNYSTSSGQLSASAAMQDAKGNKVDVATIDAGYIASAYSSPGFGVGEASNQTDNSLPVAINGLTSVSQAVVLIKNWRVQYNSVHNVQTLQVGSWGDLVFSDNTVTLPNLSAKLSDNSGHVQDDSSSSCDVLVVGLP